MNTEYPKIAVIYDRVNTFGGAERVLQTLHSLYPDSHLFTSVYDADKTSWVGDWPVHTSFLQRIPLARSHHQWFGFCMPLIFESFALDEFDIVISVTSEAAKAVLTKPRQLHVCYCLTPTRYLWSHTHEYEGKSFQVLKRLMFSLLRFQDFVISKRPDVYIPISEVVAKRIKKYYRIVPDAVLYPPVSLLPPKEYVKGPGEFFLTVSRLVAYKHIDEVIRASLELNEKLVVVGTGEDRDRLIRIANGSPLITFVGSLTDEELMTYYQRAKALICPQEEDFGIAAVEARNFGVTVISFEESGVTENGPYIAFGPKSGCSLQEAMQAVQPSNLGSLKNQERFTQKTFTHQFRERIMQLWKEKNKKGNTV